MKSKHFKSDDIRRWTVFLEDYSMWFMEADDTNDLIAYYYPRERIFHERFGAGAGQVARIRLRGQ